MTLFQVYEFAFVCCSIASVALLLWDHIITFGAEVNTMWWRKKSGGTALYTMLRYGTLFEKITVMFLASWYMTPHGCDIAVRFQIFPMVIRTLGFGAFSALRVYALRRNKWPLASFVFLLCLPSLITPAYVYAHQTSPGVDRHGCQLAYIASQTVHARLRIAGIIADLLSEIIVIIVTVNRTFHLRNEIMPLEESSRRPGLMRLLLRDGSIYFMALLTLSLADMLVLVFDNVPQFATRYDYWVVPYYTPVFRTIIICRFLLVLRSVYYDTGHEDEKDGRQSYPTSTLRFTSRVVGNMGAPLDSQFDPDMDMPWEEEDDERDESNRSDGIVYSHDPLADGMRDALHLDTSDDSTRHDDSYEGKGKQRAVGMDSMSEPEKTLSLRSQISSV
ncbi:hypothetical protein CPC08DRAFT_716638 [Agrocybe pediades]|nr:hypothetical protein CPC08DRAFT_716638 [Agrocybe pediades]